jgi:hypothetical protein
LVSDHKFALCRLSSVVVFLAFLAGASLALGQTVSCKTYLNAFNDNARLSFSYGYLEGVEAALTKDFLDVLVPPAHPNHPIWWVVPQDLTINLHLIDAIR